MAVYAKTITGKSLRDLLEKLAPLGRISGVQDYLLVDRGGRIVARKSDSFWKEETARACARDMAQVGEVFRLLSVDDEHQRVFDFRFEGTLLIAWDLGSGYLIALCSEEANLSIARMTANVVKHELRNDKRFRSYFARPIDGDCSLLTEQDLGSELYKYVAALREK